MRIGKIKIEKVLLCKPLDECFEIQIKEPIVITAFSSGVVSAIKRKETTEPVRTFPANLRMVKVVDIQTGDEFIVDPRQQSYIYSLGEDTEVNFDVVIGVEAFVFLKNVNGMHLAKKMNALATAYGRYVSLQITEKRGAKPFLTWYAEELAV